MALILPVPLFVWILPWILVAHTTCDATECCSSGLASEVVSDPTSDFSDLASDPTSDAIDPASDPTSDFSNPAGRDTISDISDPISVAAFTCSTHFDGTLCSQGVKNGGTCEGECTATECCTNGPTRCSEHSRPFTSENNREHEEACPGGSCSDSFCCIDFVQCGDLPEYETLCEVGVYSATLCPLGVCTEDWCCVLKVCRTHTSMSIWS